MSSPLNPSLYSGLVRVFRNVLIANEGEPNVHSQSPSPYRPGRVDSPAVISGEYYRVNCPYCGDTRQRLWINHMFNVMGDDGDDHLYLVNCFNENCIDERVKQKQLVDRIFPFGFRARQLQQDVSSPPVHTAASERLAPVRLPPTIPLSDPESALAAAYLGQRGFDPIEIAERWSVSYCPFSSASRPRVQHCLVIPVYTVRNDIVSGRRETVLAGWQSRVLHDSPQQSCKYLSMAGMKKNQLLYGLPQALQTEGPVIIVEGVTDVWRIGSHAVAAMGKSLSQHQVGLLLSHFRGRPLIVLFDRDARDATLSAAALLQQARQQWKDDAQVHVGFPPPGADDVGDASRESVWEAIHNVLAPWV